MQLGNKNPLNWTFVVKKGLLISSMQNETRLGFWGRTRVECVENVAIIVATLCHIGNSCGYNLPYWQ